MMDHVSRKNASYDAACLAPGTARGILVPADRIQWLFGSSGMEIPKNGHISEIDLFFQARKTLHEIIQYEIGSMGEGESIDSAGILQAHHYMLHDPVLRKEIEHSIQSEGFSAETAVEKTFDNSANRLSATQDEFLSSRATDLREIGRRLTGLLRSIPTNDSVPVSDTTPLVAVADELYVSWVLNAKECNIVGFVLREGTSLSHAVILARALGIAVIKLNENHHRKLAIGSEAEIAADTEHTSLSIPPGHTFSKPTQPRARTGSGKHNHKVWLNTVAEIPGEILSRPDIAGIGLFRTEFFFMRNRHDFPTEEEQVKFYRQVLSKHGHKPVTIRTLDIGGDKKLGHFSMGPQENPNLGLRGHRVYRYHPDLLVTQIRAILKAGRDVRDLRILYPMIESIDELLRVKAHFEEAVISLEAEGAAFHQNAEQGLMIEVPASAINARRFLKHVDFACVGTNDLLQYFFAIDRNNANVQDFSAVEDPSALSLLKSITDAAEAESTPLTLCGELASNKRYLPLIRGLGFEHLSVDEHTVDGVLETLDLLNSQSCRKLVKECINADTTAESRRMLVEFWKALGQICDEKSTEGSGRHVDPVCGMQLGSDDHQHSTIRNGVRYFFCTPRCLRLFMSKNESEDERPSFSDVEPGKEMSGMEINPSFAINSRHSA